MAVVTWFGPTGIDAAEIRLRPRCEVAQSLVTLGDVAEVFATDSGQGQRLANVELFPAPPPGKARFVRLREVEDLLVLRGINLLGHRFSGAGQVEIIRAGPVAAAPAPSTPPVSVTRRAERLAAEAIERYLAESVSDEEPWDVQVELEASHVGAISASGGKVAVRGGAPPWTGKQRFELTIKSTEGPVTIPLDAEVMLPGLVVVASHALSRGMVVQPTDVILGRIPVHRKPGHLFSAVKEVVGKETTRAIPAGKAIEQEFVRAPLLVRRGQVVTVYARSPGIAVRTTGRVRDDGSLGELVAVESLLDRTAFFARVCGIQEVEVYARASRTSQDSPEEPAERVAGRGTP